MDTVYEAWEWLMSRSFWEYIVIVIAIGLIIWEIGYLIAKARESNKNDRNGRR